MFSKLFCWALSLLFLAAIVWTGWQEPLKYHFMSAEEVARLRATPASAPQPAQGSWMFDNRRWDTSPHY